MLRRIREQEPPEPKEMTECRLLLEGFHRSQISELLSLLGTPGYNKKFAEFQKANKASSKPQTVNVIQVSRPSDVSPAVPPVTAPKAIANNLPEVCVTPSAPRPVYHDPTSDTGYRENQLAISRSLDGISDPFANDREDITAKFNPGTDDIDVAELSRALDKLAERFPET